MPHPVQCIGLIIDFLKVLTENIAKDNKIKLYLGGIIITFIVTFLSGFSGWIIERIFFLFGGEDNIFNTLFFIFILSSSLATKSLYTSVFEILNLINEGNLKSARAKLSLIVGRDVENLNTNEILRASAETASENSIDGIFAPLFWIFLGIFFWQFNNLLPGPLSMAWFFKASSTIDSMLGYKKGHLRWLGFAGAKLDDLLTLIPSRLVLITLPFCCISKQPILKIIKHAWTDGLLDSSPNSGISEAIFAYCAGVQMGGINYYKGEKITKPIIANSYPIANPASVKRILNLSLRLLLLWLLGMLIILKLFNSI